MFQITPAAAARCAEKLDRHHAEADQCVRLGIKAGKPGVSVGRPQEGETVFKHDRRVVLVLSRDVETELDGRTLGCRKTPNGPRLKLRRDA